MEAAFFWLWWQERNESTRAVARRLVEEGRLEITGGGWSMNDEAAAHYTGIIDNMALGFKTFGQIFGTKNVGRHKAVAAGLGQKHCGHFYLGFF